MTEPTKFIESNALLALQDEDEGRARELVEQLNRSEAIQLGVAASALAVMCVERVRDLS